MTIQARFKLHYAKLALLGAFVCATGCGEAGFDDPENVGSIQEALCVEQLLTPVSATASSVEPGTGFVAQNAIDASGTTRWSSAFSDPQWLSIDLGASRKISKLVLSWEAAASASYQIQVSANGTSWSTVYTDSAGNGGTDTISGLNATGRFVRVYSTARTTQWGVSLFNVAIYGDQNPSCDAPASCGNSALARSGAASSSNENATHVPGNAIDGNSGTRWSSAFANEQWLRVDLGATRRIRRVRLNWEAAYSPNYEIEVSNSTSGPWTSIWGTTVGNGGIDDITGLDATARYVRVLAHTRATPYGNSLWEVDVYGDNNPSCGSDATLPLGRKVLWLVYDPILSGGQRLHQKYGFNDPFPLVPQIVTTLKDASGGYADYQSVEVRDMNAFPPQLNRPTFTEATYDQCFHGVDCGPTLYDYGAAFASLGICSRIQSGEIDEVMIYGADWFGIDEFAFKIPGDRMPYNTPTNLWLYDLRKKNLPECGRTYFVMGFNSPVGLDNAIHSFGHRVESAASLTVGRGYWDGCAGGALGLSDWDRFTCIDIQKTPSGANVAGCGNVHYPPNGQVDYQYDNPSNVNNICPSWQSYPFTTPTQVSQNCSTYGCNQLGFLQWWLGGLPRKNGVTSNGNLRNWWKYAIDFDNALREVGNL